MNTLFTSYFDSVSLTFLVTVLPITFSSHDFFSTPNHCKFFIVSVSSILLLQSCAYILSRLFLLLTWLQQCFASAGTNISLDQPTFHYYSELHVLISVFAWLEIHSPLLLFFSPNHFLPPGCLHLFS